MRRRGFITLVAGAIAIRPFAALAQEPGRTYRLGGVSSSPRDAPFIVAVFDELHRLGFIEGKNLTIDWRSYGPRALIELRNLWRSLSKPRSMSSWSSGLLQFVRHSGQRR